MTDEEKWKRRFFLFTAARLFGLAMFIGGIFIAFTDALREGGWPELGGIIAVLGALDALLAPRLLKSVWAREDGTGDR